jgi:hypothetical protein
MHMEPVVLASRFSIIKENLQSLREAFANGLIQDVLHLATQLNCSTRQLNADLE